MTQLRSVSVKYGDHMQHGNKFLRYMANSVQSIRSQRCTAYGMSQMVVGKGSRRGKVMWPTT